MAETVAEAHSWKQRPQALGGAVKAIGEGPFDPVGRLLLGCHTLKCSIRLGESCRTGLRGIAEMSEHATTGNRGEIHFLGETTTVLFIGQDIDRQRQPAPGQHSHQTVLTARTDQAIERHG